MKPRMRRHVPLVLLALFAFSSPPGHAGEDAVLRLPIGDPERRDRDVPLVLDAITDSRTGDLLTPADLPARLAGVDILLIGESHTEIDDHRVQRRILDELDRAGRRVMIGLEMFPYTHQEHLDRWTRGLYSEEGFLELADWYEVWGYHWDYYRDVFLLARERGLPMFGINTPREVVKAVREKGFENLTEEEEAHVPSEIDVDSEDHLRLFKAYFADDESFHAQMSDEAWKSMLAAQCTWDATMATNAVKAFEGAGEGAIMGEEPIMVVLTGNGHVAYGLGIARQAARWFDGEIALLIPIPVIDGDGEATERVQASYADFVWGLPRARDPIYPSLGISTRETDDERRQVIYVAEDSPAEAAGFEVGDLLLAADGQEIQKQGDLKRLLADKRWGDALAVSVRRGEETVELTALLRRTVDDGQDDDDDDGEDDAESTPAEDG